VSEEIRYFLPGPTYVSKAVREAMTQPLCGHRSPEFKEVYRRITGQLPALFRTSRDVLVVTSSGSLVWDMAIVSGVRSSLLNLTNGAFSERFHTAAKAWGKEADQISVPWGQPIDPELVRHALRRKSYEAVTLVHNETSTGVLNPVAEIAQVVREESDALVFVDAVSSLAGARLETDAWGLDLVFTGSQKALALPPGLALVTLSERFCERAEKIPHRGFYTDLLQYLKKHRDGVTVTTPAIPQLWALEVQLKVIEAEGLESRWKRHLNLRQRTESWAAASGFTYASNPRGASPTVSCLRPPQGTDAPALVGALKDRGFTLGGGYGKWKPTTFRLGHMGEVQLSDLERLLAAIDLAVA
jgi:aspartate aminotransferase-like enzyme